MSVTPGRRRYQTLRTMPRDSTAAAALESAKRVAVPLEPWRFNTLQVVVRNRPVHPTIP
jgi:hypothetical protein